MTRQGRHTPGRRERRSNRTGAGAGTARCARRHTKGSTSMKCRTRILGNPAWWAEAHKVTQIPTDQLPEGDQRDTLIALALLGEAEVYTPIGSDRWNIWFEQPIRERLTIADWLARTEAQYR